MQRRPGGELYEVMHKAVAIRYLPSTTADLVATRILGQFVELFEESDARRQKRLASGHKADKKWRKMEDAECQEEARPWRGDAKHISRSHRERVEFTRFAKS